MDTNKSAVSSSFSGRQQASHLVCDECQHTNNLWLYLLEDCLYVGNGGNCENENSYKHSIDHTQISVVFQKSRLKSLLWKYSTILLELVHVNTRQLLVENFHLKVTAKVTVHCHSSQTYPIRINRLDMLCVASSILFAVRKSIKRYRYFPSSPQRAAISLVHKFFEQYFSRHVLFL